MADKILRFYAPVSEHWRKAVQAITEHEKKIVDVDTMLGRDLPDNVRDGLLESKEMFQAELDAMEGRLLYVDLKVSEPLKSHQCLVCNMPIDGMEEGDAAVHLDCMDRLS